MVTSDEFGEEKETVTDKLAQRQQFFVATNRSEVENPEIF